MDQPRETPRIVLVDDEPDFHAVVRDWMKPAYDCVSLTSGEKLLEKLDALEPDLLILDVMLPGVEGYALCRAVRAQRRFMTLPILFLTARRSDADFFKYVAAGGTAYLSKPVSRGELLEQVRALLPGAATARA